MLNYKNYRIIENLKESDPDSFSTIKDISAFCQNTASRGCHDIRNYAALISSYCQLIAMSNPELSANPYFARIEQNTSDMLKLLDAIGNLRYSFKDFSFEIHSLSSIINEAIVSLSPSVNVTVVSDTDYDKCLCDSARITEAFLSILTNCTESPGCDKVSISVGFSDTDGTFDISFLDNGSGFSSEMINQALTPFSTEKDGHFGLGLSTASVILLRHKGNLSVSNTPKGALVKVSLPVYRN